MEDQPLRSLAGQESDERTVPSGEDVRREHLHGEPTTHTWLAVIYASIVWAGTTYIVRVRRSPDQRSAEV